MNLIIDFDGTFTSVEALDELANISLENNPNKDKILEKIEEITKQGMEGKLSFDQSLKKRFKLLKITKSHINQLVEFLKTKISRSILENHDFFIKNKDNIYIFSGGFKDFIVPVIKYFGIKEKNVYANTFYYDKDDNVVGYDKDNKMAQGNGKSMTLKDMNLGDNVIVIGDGYTDYLTKKTGLVKSFIAYTENFSRDLVVNSADLVAKDFDDIIITLNKKLILN